MSYLFAQGLGESTSELGSQQAETLARSVSWRGKLMRPQFWSRAWKTYPWTRLLSGVTSPPSEVQTGVESWIASLRDTRASRSPSPVDVVGWMTPGTSGPTSHGSSGSQEQLGLFSKTSPAICPSGSTKSAATFTAWSSRLRRVYSARLKSGRHIAANGCSSWATANAHDGMRPGSDATSTQGRNLKREAEHWPTATTMDTMDAARKGIVGNHNLSLPVAAKEWATPVSSDDGKKVTTASLQPGLIGQQAEWSGLLDPAETGRLSTNRYGRRCLNPRFVEWLMGWPHGWTDFAPAGTERCLFVQRMRSELSRLPWLDA
jgi:hypothetical protein